MSIIIFLAGSVWAFIGMRALYEINEMTDGALEASIPFDTDTAWGFLLGTIVEIAYVIAWPIMAAIALINRNEEGGEA
jgi:hypothetical protein